MKTVELKVADLETCDRTRVRKIKPNIDSDVVEEYAEAYRNGLIVEPLDVFQEKGTERFIVADGEHRLLGLQRAKIPKATIRLREGSETDALDFAIGCNQAHGVRRTKADKYHAFERILETPLREKYKTDTALSEKLGVSVRTIATYKAQWRDSENGDARARKKKEKAQSNAATHNGAAKSSPSSSDSAPSSPTPKAPTVAKDKPKRKDDGDGWTREDELDCATGLGKTERLATGVKSQVADFSKSFKKLSRLAQIHIAPTVSTTVRELAAELVKTISDLLR